MTSHAVLNISPEHCTTYLERVYERQVVQSDIIVIILNVTECFLVIFHQRVNLAVFALK